MPFFYLMTRHKIMYNPFYRQEHAKIARVRALITEPKGRKMKRRNVCAVLAAMLVGLVAMPSLTWAEDTRPDTVWDAIKKDKDLSKFAEMASDAGVESELKKADATLTVFAPSNDAMGKISSAVMKKIKSDKAHLRSYVLYHTIIGSAVFTDSIRNRAASPSMGNGEMLGFDGRGGKELKVGTAKIIKTDIGAKNGVVQIVDGPLVPLSLDDVASQKLKDDQIAERRKMDEEREARQKEMDEMRAKLMAKSKGEAAKAASEAKAVTEPAASAASAASTASQPAATESTSAASTAATTEKKTEEKKDDKSGWNWKKMFNF